LLGGMWRAVRAEAEKTPGCLRSEVPTVAGQLARAWGGWKAHVVGWAGGDGQVSTWLELEAVDLHRPFLSSRW
jgi:hypothetical protein